MDRIKSFLQDKSVREVVLYLFFGGIAFFLNIILFYLFTVQIGINALTGNIICWIICVLFQFVTNRTWVFRANSGESDQKVQLVEFFSGRLLTLLMEELILFVFINKLHLQEMAVKIAAQVFVIIANYLLSKFWVFKE